MIFRLICVACSGQRYIQLPPSDISAGRKAAAVLVFPLSSGPYNRTSFPSKRSFIADSCVEFSGSAPTPVNQLLLFLGCCVNGKEMAASSFSLHNMADHKIELV
jgi:hypothetical protein